MRRDGFTTTPTATYWEAPVPDRDAPRWGGLETMKEVRSMRDRKAFDFGVDLQALADHNERVLVKRVKEAVRRELEG